MINVPDEFRPHINVDYPPNNDFIFEEWFHYAWSKLWVDQQINDEISNLFGRQYLPVFWTSFYVNNRYGNDKRAIDRLQEFLNSLDTTLPYFTIVQYDDGILNDVSHLNLKVFGMGGGKYDYPLPLICKPHPYSFTNTRDIFCNFLGALTHEIRKKLLPVAKRAGYLCSTYHMPIEQYCMNLSRSIFTLCPRGYGLSSFRLFEAVQYGSIPVYISDKFMLPHNKQFDYGLLINQHEIDGIDKILKSISSEEIARMQTRLKEVWPMFTYDGCKELIMKELW